MFNILYSKANNIWKKKIENRLKYWQKPDSFFLILRDKDSGDCQSVKNGLLQKVIASGKQASSCIRIACHELENFYLGDLKAVELAFGINGLSNQQEKAKFRSPDQLANPVQELSKLTKNKYQKMIGSRLISPYLKLNGTNRSHSFNQLINGIKKLIH